VTIKFARDRVANATTTTENINKDNDSAEQTVANATPLDAYAAIVADDKLIATAKAPEKYRAGKRMRMTDDSDEREYLDDLCKRLVRECEASGQSSGMVLGALVAAMGLVIAHHARDQEGAEFAVNSLTQCLRESVQAYFDAASESEQ
jgi:hypothetical protein